MRAGVVRQLSDSEVAQIVMATGNLPEPLDPAAIFVLGFEYVDDSWQEFYARRNRKLGHQVFPITWEGKPVDILYARMRVTP